MSHPSLGLPPRDATAGAPAAAASLRSKRARLAERAFAVALDADPTLRQRHDEAALRRLLDDARTLIQNVAGAVASGDTGAIRVWAETAVPIYRRHGVSMDDLVTIAEGVRSVLSGALPGDAAGHANRALDAVVEVYRWHRRLGGDARRRNRLLAFIYKGA